MVPVSLAMTAASGRRPRSDPECTPSAHRDGIRQRVRRWRGWRNAAFGMVGRLRLFLTRTRRSGRGYAPTVDATTTHGVVTPVSVRREGLAWAFAGVVMFSFSVPLTKVAVGGFSPFLTATGRAVIAGVVAGALLAVGRVPFPPAEQRRPLLYTMLGAVFGWPILLALALERTTSAHVAVIAAFMPLTTALVAVLRTHERVTWQFWAAAGTGTAALVAFALSRGGSDGGGDLVADGLVV